MLQIDRQTAKLLREFLQTDGTPTPELFAALQIHASEQFNTQFDRLVFVFRQIPERAALYLARSFLNHADVSINKTIFEPELNELIGEPSKSERRPLTGFSVAFWGEGWKLAREAAIRMQRNRVHSDSELEFQKYATLRVLDVLINGKINGPPTEENGG